MTIFENENTPQLANPVSKKCSLDSQNKSLAALASISSVCE